MWKLETLFGSQVYIILLRKVQADCVGGFTDLRGFWPVGTAICFGLSLLKLATTTKICKAQPKLQLLNHLFLSNTVKFLVDLLDHDQRNAVPTLLY